jgi:hypothetical protein
MGNVMEQLIIAALEPPIIHKEIPNPEEELNQFVRMMEGNNPPPQQPRPKQIKLKLRMRTVSTSYLLILMIQHVCCNSCQLNMPLMRC